VVGRRGWPSRGSAGRAHWHRPLGKRFPSRAAFWATASRFPTVRAHVLRPSGGRTGGARDGWPRGQPVAGPHGLACACVCALGDQRSHCCRRPARTAVRSCVRVWAGVCACMFVRLLVYHVALRLHARVPVRERARVLVGLMGWACWQGERTRLVDPATLAVSTAGRAPPSAASAATDRWWHRWWPKPKGTAAAAAAAAIEDTDWDRQGPADTHTPWEVCLCAARSRCRC
jgi:hypothetical protein